MKKKPGFAEAMHNRMLARAEQSLHLFHVTARQELQWWLLTLVGAGFIYAGITVDPQSNCSADGECAPWLVPIAFGMGLLAFAMGLGHLIANPHRGSRVDFAARRLYWWQSKEERDAHSLSLDDVARIKVRAGDDNDGIFLYDHDGNLLPFPDQGAVPWAYQDWATALTGHFPHIALEIER